jgi:ABC-type transport system involved in cytochrome bd biosynthesis, ATPase and permease components
MARDIDRRLIAAGHGARRGLSAAIALGFTAGIAVIVQAFLLARIVSALVFHDAGLAAEWRDLLVLLVLFIIRAALSYGAEIAAYRAAAVVKLSLRRSLLDHLFALGPGYAGGERSADLATTLLDGVEALEPYLARYLPQMALVAMVPLAILAVVLRSDWISALILVVSGPIIPLFMVFIGYRAEAINQRQWRQLLVMSAYFLDAVQGITTLKLFGRARDEIALIGRISDEYRRVTMEGLRVAFLTSAALEFFASLSIALIAVLFGARLIHGDITFFPAFFVLLLVPEFFLPLRGLATHYHARMTAIAAARRIFDVLDATPSVRWGTETLSAGAISIACTGLTVEHTPGPGVARYHMRVSPGLPSRPSSGDRVSANQASPRPCLVLQPPPRAVSRSMAVSRSIRWIGSRGGVISPMYRRHRGCSSAALPTICALRGPMPMSRRCTPPSHAPGSPMLSLPCPTDSTP